MVLDILRINDILELNGRLYLVVDIKSIGKLVKTEMITIKCIDAETILINLTSKDVTKLPPNCLLGNLHEDVILKLLYS